MPPDEYATVRRRNAKGDWVIVPNRTHEISEEEFNAAGRKPAVSRTARRGLATMSKRKRIFERDKEY